MRKKKGFEDLKKEVIQVGLCTACGTCVGVCTPRAIEMEYEKDEPEPKLVGKCTDCSICYEVCPGKDIPLPDLDQAFLGRKRDFAEETVGIFQACYKGHALNKYIKATSSSGGMVSGLLTYALEEGIIEAAIFAVWRKDKPWRCQPFIATNPEQVLQGMRTGPMIVPNNALLFEAAISKKYKKIGVVGLPCHIHGLRKMQKYGKPKKVIDSLKIMIGLFCAATYYWEGTKHLLAEFGSIKEIEDIVAMDYRGGAKPGGLYVLTRDGKIHFIAGKHDYTWHFLGAATYKRDRCLMCVDFSAELADIACGDIFQRGADPTERWVATVARTRIGQELITGAHEKGHIHVEEHDSTLIPASGLGWEAKKHAGMYRLIQRRNYGWPAPNYHYPLKVEPVPRKLVFPS